MNKTQKFSSSTSSSSLSSPSSLSSATIEDKKDHRLFKIAIISGKGGVGKTSITSGLAFALHTQKVNLILADADVDAPNLAILFSHNPPQEEDQNDTRKLFHIQSSDKAEVVKDNCIQCRQCIEENFCAFGALQWNNENNFPEIDAIACEGCKACALLCPNQAFLLKPVENGIIEIADTDYGFPIITGETILGSQTSGKLVTELRNIAENQASHNKADLLLTDGPPGIGCPVLAAISGMDFVILITEPTSAALHDVERAIQIVNSFNIPFGIIVNKANMNEDMHNHMLTHFFKLNYEILGEFPLNSNWPYAIVNRQPINEFLHDSEISDIFFAIAQKLKSKIKNIKV